MYDVLSRRHTNIPLCVGGGGGEKKRERGGLLTWLEWLFCSCAIISGGALRAALQQHTALHKTMEKWPCERCRQLSLHRLNKYLHTWCSLWKVHAQRRRWQAFIHRQVTMKVCHQLKQLILKIILEELVTPVITPGSFSEFRWHSSWLKGNMYQHTSMEKCIYTCLASKKTSRYDLQCT